MLSSSLRIIVLKDHSFQRAIVVNILEKLEGTKIFQAASSLEALSILKNEGPVDIAVCDLCMNDMDGLGFLQAVGQTGLVNSIITSSSLSEDLRFTAHQIISSLDMQFLGDLKSPSSPEELQCLLRKYIPAQRDKTAPEPPIFVDDDRVCQAISNHEICSFYQPQFNLKTGEIIGAEVLARWPQTHGKILPPNSFLPSLERHGLMQELLNQQLHKGLTLQQRLKARGYELNLSFNLQPDQLSNSIFVSQVITLLRKYETKASSITFELTEGSLLDVSGASLESLFRLRLEGCRLSLDDFGSGFSSLRRLCKLPFNEIKLDASFSQGIIHETRCNTIISSTLEWGKAFDMTVIAEGIETEKQRKHLISLGCLQGQGYWYAMPMSDAELLQWIG